MIEEEVVLVDDAGRDCRDAEGRILTAGKLEAHTRGLRHRAVSVFVFNRIGQVLLQRRASGKYHSAGLWSNTCCTHPRRGESPQEAGQRRLQEEMGISCRLEERFVFSYCAIVGCGLTENEYDHVCVGWSEGKPDPDPAEVGEWKWVDCEALRIALDREPQQYTYWLAACFMRVLEELGALGIGTNKTR
ncbi:MAG TPA: isopentenyl-diphosphate Delta-isomerase [Thermodesulfobacteriota bacterium]|nr:isopentenyl-diphosphate Delta-isomerase [Deltaproteobacteria bacterium]HNU73084.1 isopentenyl-diphosphate Delta-isomerase [Thermodesulfobacteriota bacterium]HOC38785.1 isopentenyl-diphosphate Delta-isomerase [Thermodesulfobacteriota bacterium]HQO77340.1 isopentenyl-diphosphate Delta-isomerase [Thermodesulfobacteriota bacterium]